jgi:hypothetical protein
MLDPETNERPRPRPRSAPTHQQGIYSRKKSVAQNVAAWDLGGPKPFDFNTRIRGHSGLVRG